MTLPDPRKIWLLPMLGIVRRSDAEIRKLLEKAAQAAHSDIVRLGPKTGFGATIRKTQLATAERALQATLARLFLDIGDNVKANRLAAAIAALDSSFDWDLPLFKRAGFSAERQVRLRESLLAISDRNVELMLKRFTSHNIPLSRQVYKTQFLSRGLVERAINIGIGRGLTAKELAKEVEGMIKPNVKGGVSYAAMRLARTEINNAFHAAAKSASATKPWIVAVEWKLSNSHPKPDICDEYARVDHAGFGPGAFPKQHVPDKPHPHCFCYTVPKAVAEDDFVSSFISGDYDDFLARSAG